MTVPPLANSARGYGLVAILLHWVMAVLLLVLFALGLYMVELDYTHPWYRTAPHIHRGLGVLAFLLLAVRWGWRLANPLPVPAGRPWERRAALWVHRLFYLLVAVVAASGWLISTADGRPVSVFGWFEVPAVFYGHENQEDTAGWIHRWLAWGLMALAGLHTAAALKHHLVDRDATLRRMLVPGGGTPPPSSTTREDEMP